MKEENLMENGKQDVEVPFKNDSFVYLTEPIGRGCQRIETSVIGRVVEQLDSDHIAVYFSLSDKHRPVNIKRLKAVSENKVSHYNELFKDARYGYVRHNN